MPASSPPAFPIASASAATDHDTDIAVNTDRGYTANGLNQYSAVAGAGFGYDANGKLTSDGANSYTYDVENRLVSRGGGASASLRYDPLGRLYEVSGGSGTIRFLHDGDALVAEYDPAGNLLRRYVHGAAEGADDPLVWFEGASVADSARRYLFADERGSVVAVTDGNGTALAIDSYNEYGIPAAGNQGRFQYTGQAWLPELGMFYYKARMYSPTLGRFMQTDPIGYADGMNMYAYVGGDPVNLIDPSGRFAGFVVTGTRLKNLGMGYSYGGSDGAMYFEYPSILDDAGGSAPQNDLPCQNKSLGVQLGEAALGGLALLGDGAQVVGAYTGFVPLAAAGTAAEYVSIGGSALLHWSTGDTHGLIEDGANFAAGLAPGGRIARKVGGAAADWGRRANGQYAKGWNRKQKAQNAAYSSGQSTLASGGSICPVKSG